MFHLRRRGNRAANVSERLGEARPVFGTAHLEGVQDSVPFQTIYDENDFSWAILRTMETDKQGVLLEVPEQPPAPAAPPAEGGRQRRPKLKAIDRDQGVLRMVVVEELVGPDHKVRAIWDLTGQFDLSALLGKVKSQEGEAGCSAWNPRLLLSIWLYAYSEQVTSARKVAAMMEYEPGLMWLAGIEQVGYHTLSDFRSQHLEELKKWLAELLGLLSKEGYVQLETVMHDGTKIRTQGGVDQFRRERTLERETARAWEMVEELEREREKEETSSARREAARQRAARERMERMKQAAAELQKIRAAKESAQECDQVRVCLSEPEARMMKHGDNAIAPSYNVQISTDAEHKIVVGVHLTQSSSDSGSLPAAMEEVRETAGHYPKQVVVDGGFTNQQSIEQMSQIEVEMYGSLVEPEVRQAAAMKAAGIDPAFGPAAFLLDQESRTLRCPAGKSLPYVRQSRKREDTYHQYQASGSDCGGCPFQKRCCPKHPEQGRLVSLRQTENAHVAAFRAKMKTPEAQQIYKQRGAVAEFPNGWIKEKLGIRKFRLRGLRKATTEAFWGVLTYDVMQWIRLSWRPQRAALVPA